MKILKFKTNLRCESCLAKIKPLLDGDKTIQSWEVNLAASDKVLTVSGDNVDVSRVKELLKQVGYDAQEFKEVPIAINPVSEPSPQTYFPLMLIFAYLVGGIAIFQLQAPIFNIKEVMGQFMGGFFIIFSFFKLLNLKGFSDAYSTYDLLAKRWPSYGYIYPFIELGLGIAYWSHIEDLWVDVATIVVMGFSSLGVMQSLMQKQKIKCACLGTVFNLPMSSITLIEDLLMMIMAISMVILSH